MKTTIRKIALAFTAAILLLTGVPLAASAAPGAVAGTLTDASGHTVGHTWLSIRNEASGEEYTVWVADDGSFSLPSGLAAGGYEAVKYWDEAKQTNVYLNQSFAVSGGSAEPLKLETLPNNVSGTVRASDGSAVSGWVDIKDAAGGAYSAYAGTDGAFALRLPAGNYKVQGFTGESSREYMNVKLAFTVGAASVTLPIKLSAKNMNGTLKRGGQAVASAWLNFYNTSTQELYSAQVKDGVFAAALPDGKYTIDGYWLTDSDTFVTYAARFTVAGATTVALDVPASNLTGTLHQGEAAVSNVWLNIRTTDYAKNYSVRTTANGAFDLTLPDGRYVVDGYFDAEGRYVRLNQPMEPLRGVAVWTLSIPAPNVSGTLKLADGTPVDGVTLRMQNMEGERSSYETQVKDGEFSLYLPDGLYAVRSYWDERQQANVLLNRELIVENGAVQGGADIVVPAVNVKGTLSDANGEPIANVWLDIRSGNHLRSYQVKTDADGSFALALPDGDYNVNGYSSEDYQRFIRLDQNYSVSGSAQWRVQEKRINVTGELVTAEGQALPEGAYLNLYQVKSDGWYGFTIKTTDGKFRTTLEDGRYLIRGISYEEDGRTKRIGFYDEFTVSGEAALRISVPPVNVKGTVVQSGIPLDDGTVNFYDVSHPNDNLSVDVTNGAFDLALKPGQYKVADVFDRPKQVYYQVDQTFTVDAKGVFEWPLALKERNVEGIVKLDDGSTPRNVSLQIGRDLGNGQTDREQQVDLVDGKFFIYLPDGDYAISFYYDREKQESIRLAQPYRFSVAGSAKIEDLVLPTPNVVGTAYMPGGSEALAFAGISIRSSEQGDVYYNANAGQNGTFSLKLPDGSYAVTELQVWKNGQRSAWKSEATFRVVNGALTTPDGGPLRVVARENNVVGRLAMPDGAAIAGSLKLIDANQTAYNIRIQNGQFSDYLPDGVYHIGSIWNDTNGRDERAADAGYTITIAGGVASPSPIAIEVAAKNLYGKVEYADGSPAIGQLNLQHSDTASSDPSPREVYGMSGGDGTFAIDLPPNTYRLVSFQASNGTAYMLDGTEIVVGERMTTAPAIRLNAPNIQGTLNIGGDAALNGFLSIAEAEFNPSAGVHYRLGVRVDNGAFRVYLPDGDYIATNFNSSATHENTMLQIRFTVIGGRVEGGLQIESQ